MGLIRGPVLPLGITKTWRFVGLNSAPYIIGY
jgi:hypothetical protein